MTIGSGETDYSEQLWELERDRFNPWLKARKEQRDAFGSNGISKHKRKVESLEGACQALEEVWQVYQGDDVQKSQT